MKIRKLKKALKTAKIPKLITFKDITLISFTKGIKFLITFIPDTDKLKFNKFGITIIDKKSNLIFEYFPYSGITKIANIYK